MIPVTVTVSSLQRTTKPLTENSVVCVIRNSEPVFYTLSPNRYLELLNKEAQAAEYLETIDGLASGKLHIEDLI